MRLLRDRDVVAELRLAAKMTLAGTLAWWAASELGAHRPLFAVLVPLVTMSGDPFSAIAVSIDRLAGIFAGVGIGIGLIHVGIPGTTRVAIAIGLGTALGVVLRVGQRVNVQAAISALFMLAVAGSSHAGVARVWETAVGAAISVPIAALVWPPDPVRELRRRVERLRQELAADIAAIADDLATGNGAAAARLADVREHSVEAIRDMFELDPARRSLRWSPLRRRDSDELAELERRIELAARVYRHTRAVARDVADAGGEIDARAASALRDVADAVDRVLTGHSAADPLRRAEQALDEAGGAVIIRAQLRQLLADLRARVETAGSTL